MKRFLVIVMSMVMLTAVLTSCTSNLATNLLSTGTPAPTGVPSVTSTLKIGDYVQVGKYFEEPILWRCVDIDENGPLMLSDRILTIKPYDAQGSHKYLDGTLQPNYSNYRTTSGSNIWQTSNMRAWLNSTSGAGKVVWPDGCPPTQDKVYKGNNAYSTEKGFIADGNFTSDERSIMKAVNQKSLISDMDASKLSIGGNTYHTYSSDISRVLSNYDKAYYQNVTDTMFLLDVKQIKKAFQNSSKLGTNYYIGKPTQNAVDNSNYKNPKLNPNANWYCYLRSPNADSPSGGDVRELNLAGEVVSNAADNGMLGVRPAFYINLPAAIFVSGLGSPDSPYILYGGSSGAAVDGITLNKTDEKLMTSQMLQLTPNVSPSNATVKSVKWTSSDTNVITVSSSGGVTAIGSGEATVTVVSDNRRKFATCKITVIPQVTSVKLNMTKISLSQGKTFKLIPTIYPANASNKKVAWKSSNNAIATVSSTGVISWIKPGTAYINVYTVDGKKSAKCEVKILDYNSSYGTNIKFSDLSGMEFLFSSGAGGWGTVLKIFSDGKFEGNYSDSDMGDTGPNYPNGIRYECSFSGKFSSLKRTGKYEYSLKCVSIKSEGIVGKEKIVDGVKVINSDPYGIEEVGDFYLYVPGKKTSGLSEEFLGWINGCYRNGVIITYVLRNVGGEEGFYVWPETAN
ncbi:MAG: Ig-like domain-containing protein [Bacillota bacterium]